MLAVVSRTFAAVSALEKYEQNGNVDRRNALYAEAAALGKTISGRFLVICLEEIRYKSKAKPPLNLHASFIVEQHLFDRIELLIWWQALPW